MKPDQERINAFKTTRRAVARSIALSAAVCAGIALSACTSMGTGSGSVTQGGEPVTFAWTSSHFGLKGTMTATLAGRQTFSGPYLEITRELRNDDLYPLNAGWPFGWADWDGWSAFEEPAFATQYSGRVMANLQAADGRRMRCRFQLSSPFDGMTGGGRGECQLDNGRTVTAMFPPGTTKVGTAE